MVFNWVPFKTRNLLLYCISISPISFLEWTLIRQSVLTWDTKEENPEWAEQEWQKMITRTTRITIIVFIKNPPKLRSTSPFSNQGLLLKYVNNILA